MSKVSLVTTVLESEGHLVAVQLGHATIISITNDNVLDTYEIRTAAKDGNRQPMLRCTNITTTFIAAVSEDKMEVWLIPSVDISSLKAIRLGSRFEQYKYTVKVYKQSLHSVDLSLDKYRYAARDAARKMKEIKK